MNLIIFYTLLIFQASNITVALDSSENEQDSPDNKFTYVVEMKYSCPSGIIAVCSATTSECDWKLGTLKDLERYRQGMEKTAKNLERNAEYYDQSAELSPNNAKNLRDKAKSIRRDAREAREKGKKCRGPVSFETNSDSDSREIVEADKRKFSCPSGVLKVCSAALTRDCDWATGTATDLAIYQKGMEEKVKYWETIAAEEHRFWKENQKRNHAALLDFKRWNAESAKLYAREARDTRAKCRASKKSSSNKKSPPNKKNTPNKKSPPNKNSPPNKKSRRNKKSPPNNNSPEHSLETHPRNIFEADDLKYSCPSGVIKVCSATDGEECDWKTGTAKDLAIYRKGMKEQATALDKKAANQDKYAKKRDKLFGQGRGNFFRKSAASARQYAREARASSAKCQTRKRKSK
jgi:hypothetical protein